MAMNEGNRTWGGVVAMACGLLFFCPEVILGADPNEASLLDMSLEELMQVEVVSSARRAQPIKRVNSAVYVITAEDIRMSGASRLTDLFRLVPGMVVSDSLSFSSEVGIRGFALHNPRQVQMLLDGRSMYDAYKGGTEFDFQPILLEEIERIEVIRGPGGVAWGANAMNGVINIITKKAADTQGAALYGKFGDYEHQEGSVQYGSTVKGVAWRTTVGGYHTNGFGKFNGDALWDPYEDLTLSGRADVSIDANTSLMLSGAHREGAYSTNGTIWTHPSLQYMNAVWHKKLSESDSFQVMWGQNYWRLTHNPAYDAWSREGMLELQHTFVAGPHTIVWGADYTRDSFETRPTGYVAIDDPNSFSNDQFSAFVEDEITLREDLWLTLGYRAQHNELTQYDWAGRAALVWEVTPQHYLRGGVSRAFSRPVMQGYFIREEKTLDNIALFSDQNIGNEHLVAYELGYRGKVGGVDLSVDGFYNLHTDLIGQKGTGTPPTYLRNVLDVDTYGVETTVSFRPFKWWLVRGFHAYTHQEKQDTMNETPNRLTMDPVPPHKAGLTNRFYLDDNTTLNTQLLFTDTFYDHGRVSSRIKADPYTRFDVRLARQFWKKTAEVAVGVTNLTDPWHTEGTRAEIPRQVYVQGYFRFK